MKKNIALVAGGYSGESVISIQSAQVIIKNIDPGKYVVYKIMISREAWYYEDENHIKISVDKNDFSLFITGKKITFDAVFIAIHGTPGEDGRLQGYFDMLEIPYTSCGAVTSALTFNKSFCNKIVASWDIVKVAKSVHIYKEQSFNEREIIRQLQLPVFVKPAEGGSSIGMTKVKNDSEELGAAVEKAFKEDSQVLIEEFIKGREFSCGLFYSKGKVITLPVTEIITTREFFDYEAKYTPGQSQEITPADVLDEITLSIQQTAKLIYEKINCKGIARIDFILQDKTEELYFLEINTMPGQSENSIVPRQVKAAGMTLQQFYGLLLEECLQG
jgi:D-alanine-D-alanine ligase